MATAEPASAPLDRRDFLRGAAALAAAWLAQPTLTAQNAAPRPVFLVPNFHPASCGWLTTFSRERVYCANSYLNHLDRVRDDPHYAFVLSEINNIIAIMNFAPQRMPELKQRIAEQRVEAVNAFFLESTINLSGGEALVRLGVLGQRWYREVLGTSPRHAWNIDTCGVHDQMPQIVAGLGLDALVYTRKNPTGQTLFWSTSPDGSRVLTLCPGPYAEASDLFTAKAPLTAAQLAGLEDLFEQKQRITPAGAPILVLGGSGDYSLAPAVPQYPSLFLQQWSQAEPGRPVRFTTLGAYIDALQPALAAGHIDLPSFTGGTAYDFDAFWIENQEVKTRYRACEHALQAAEALAAAASLRAAHPYPVQPLHDAWILMSLNMDRNSLWGSAGGMVFVDPHSWDVADRLDWVSRTTATAAQAAASSLLPSGQEFSLFNPLSWSRTDPIALQLPPGRSLEGLPCEALDDGSVLCQPPLASMSLASWPLAPVPPAQPAPLAATETVETPYYLARFDPRTGSLTSLRLRASGRELLAGPANLIVADRPRKATDPADHMPPIPQRERLATSSDFPSTLTLRQGPLATTVHIDGTFYGGGRLRRTVRFYAHHPRIDFETELNDIPNLTIVYAEFPLAEDIPEVRRGIPYGFSHGAWSTPNPALHGWTKGIVPAVRWIDCTLAAGGGLALFDRGLSGRELNARTLALYLLNAEDQYWGYPNPWLSGRGRHLAPYALLPHAEPWHEARVPHAAFEYNAAPLSLPGRAHAAAASFLRTSPNVIVEALRREGDHLEIRLVEALGLAGEGEVSLLLPHTNLRFTDFMGKTLSTAPHSSSYKFPLRPQQIVTLHCATAAALPDPQPVTAWDPFVPPAKLPALHAYDPSLIGHPPFGE